jgi:hypothetical protein
MFPSWTIASAACWLSSSGAGSGSTSDRATSSPSSSLENCKSVKTKEAITSYGHWQELDLLDFDIHRRKTKHESCKNNAFSQCSVTWQTDAIGLQKCDLGLPSHLLSPKNSPGTFRCNLVHTKSHKNWFRHLKVDEEGYTYSKVLS